MAQLVKSPPAMQETWVQSLGWEDPLEKGKATLQYSGLENSMDCIVHEVAKSQTQLATFIIFPKSWLLSHHLEMQGHKGTLHCPPLRNAVPASNLQDKQQVCSPLKSNGVPSSALLRCNPNPPPAEHPSGPLHITYVGFAGEI